MQVVIAVGAYLLVAVLLIRGFVFVAKSLRKTWAMRKDFKK